MGLKLDKKTRAYLKNDIGVEDLEIVSLIDSKDQCERNGLTWHDLMINNYFDQGYKIINATNENSLKSYNNTKIIRLQHKITGSIIGSDGFCFNGFTDDLPEFKACTLPCHGHKPCLRYVSLMAFMNILLS